MGGLIRALRHRNFRRFFYGQAVSVFGSWMQQVALSWLAYRLTNSTFLIGLIAFCNLIPLLPFAPVGGLVADRHDKRRVLLLTQSLFLVQSLMLIALVLHGSVQPWQLVVLSLGMGFINAIDIPTRQAFVIELVDDRNDLPNAIAMNSAIYNAARTIGPAVGGYVISVWGEGVCLIVNALSYCGVLIALSGLTTRHGTRLHAAPLEALRQAFSYIRGKREISLLIAFIAAFGFCVVPYQVLIPYFAREVYGGDAHTYGVLMGVNGCGALIGVILLANRAKTEGLDRAIGLATLGAGLGLAAFALCNVFWLGLLMMTWCGFCTFFTLAACNTWVQSKVIDEMRGRVMSLYYVAMAGVSPLGSLTMGWAAESIGVHLTLVIAASAAGVAGYSYLRAIRGNRPASG